MIVDEENENKEKRLICSRTNEALIQKKKKKFKSAYAEEKEVVSLPTSTKSLEIYILLKA